MELTIDEITTLVFQHSKLARSLRKSADEHDKLAQVYLEVGKRFNREAEEKESKMKLRNILSGIVTLLVMLMLVGSLSVTKAQGDVPEATAAVTASVNGNPVESTLEPVGGTPAPVDQTNTTLSIVLDKLTTLIMIAGLILLAYKAAGLVPKETFDSALEKGFGLVKEITNVTPTPIDDHLFEMLKPGLKQLLDTEFARRNGALVSETVDGTVTIKPPVASNGFPDANALIDEMRKRGADNI